MLSRIKRKGQRIFLNDSQGALKLLNGVQDISFSYQSVTSSYSFLGSRKTFYAPSSPQIASINVNSLLFYEDFFYNKIFTEDGFSGKIESGDKGFSFQDAHLVSYSSSCAVGEIPSISMQADIYGEVKSEPEIEATKESLNSAFRVAGFNSLRLKLGDIFDTNRVLSYSLSASVKRKPVYEFNKKSPENVILDNPVEFSAQFRIEVDQYEIENIRDIEKANFGLKELTLVICENSTSDIIQSFGFKNVIIDSENYSYSVDSNVFLDLSVRGYRSF